SEVVWSGHETSAGDTESLNMRFDTELRNAESLWEARGGAYTDDRLGGAGDGRGAGGGVGRGGGLFESEYHFFFCNNFFNLIVRSVVKATSEDECRRGKRDDNESDEENFFHELGEANFIIEQQMF